jgi:hypothetical protein
MIRIRSVLFGLVLLAAAAPAQGRLGIGIDRHGKHRHVAIDVQLPGIPHLRHRRHVHAHSCRRWIPPRCEVVVERVWIPERCERTWCPPVYREVTDGRGRTRHILVQKGRWQKIHHPGRWENVSREVHVPGRWEYVCGH